MAALQMPKTSILDNHTKLFIFLSKYTVKGGRARAELARDIKLPYPKTIIVSPSLDVTRQRMPPT